MIARRRFLPPAFLIFGAALSWALAGSAYSDEPSRSSVASEIDQLRAEIAELQRQVDLLAHNAEEAAKNAPTPQVAVEPVPAEARSVYHLAGYGFANFVAPSAGSSSFTQASFNPIFHALYDDRILFESELEIASNTDGSTDVGLEYATIGWLFSDHAALVVGRFLSPLGSFRQNMHPAWINRLASPPPGFGHDGAAPSGELGAELRGGWSTTPIGRLNYAAYIGNGPELEAGAEGLMAVMTEGLPRDLDGSKVGGGRLGWLPVPSLELGVSLATGRAAVTMMDGVSLMNDPSRAYRAEDVDLAWRPLTTLEIRGEYVRQKAGAAALSVAPDSADWRAWYLQAAYRLNGRPWEAVARHGDFSGPEEDEALTQDALGINYWLGSATVIRATYEFNQPKIKASVITDRLIMQIAHGF